MSMWRQHSRSRMRSGRLQARHSHVSRNINKKEADSQRSTGSPDTNQRQSICLTDVCYLCCCLLSLAARPGYTAASYPAARGAVLFLAWCSSLGVCSTLQVQHFSDNRCVSRR